MKKLLAIILVVLLTLSLCACGAKAASTEAAAPMEAPAVAVTADYAAEESGLGIATESKNSTLNASAPEAQEENPEKIIYSADVTVETTAFDESIAGLNQLIADCGGWVQSSSVNGADYYSASRGYSGNRSAYYTLRIPSEHFSKIMNSFSTLGNVPYSYTYTQNVTAQYYDTEARLNAYTAQEARLIQMLDAAETISDIIAIEEKLAELRYEIESLQSSLNNWDRRVSYSTINVSIEEVREYTPEAKMSYGEQLLRSFVDGLKDVGRFFKNLLVVLVGAIPTLVVLAVLFVVLRPAVKKLRAKRKAKKENKPE